jgi:adenylate cyclase
MQAFLVEEYELLAQALASADRLPMDLPLTTSGLLQHSDLEHVVRSMRRIFLADPGLAAELRKSLDERAVSRERRQRELALIAMYAGADSRYLNYFGPTETIQTHAYQDIVGPDGGLANPSEFAGQVVFVGYSERRQSEQQDEFISVYSAPTGLSLSGVEIAATAFANLLARNSIGPIGRGWESIFLIAWGTLIGLAIGRLRLSGAFVAGLIFAVGYLWTASYTFSVHGAWLPVVVPLGFQLPALLLGDTLLRYRDLSAQRERIRRALGPYLPPAVLAQLARDTLTVGVDREVVHGTCLVTDVRGYTTLAEQLHPGDLAALMHEYFQLIRRVVTAHGGSVADVSGDSTVGLWVAADDTGANLRQAIAAARALSVEIRGFNDLHPLTELQTGIGLESGEVALSRTETADPFVYRAVGDIVNTASRVQGLNRLLETAILVSTSTDFSGDLAPCRRVGKFQLLGKIQAVELWEILPHPANIPVNDPSGEIWVSSFEHALYEFTAGEFARAAAGFSALLQQRPGDGPTQYYVHQCALRARLTLPIGWDGTIVLAHK